MDKLDELMVWLRQRIIDEQNHLAEDVPGDNCAAMHYVAVDAYKRVMDHVQKMLQDVKFSVGSVWMKSQYPTVRCTILAKFPNMIEFAHDDGKTFWMTVKDFEDSHYKAIVQ